MTNNYGVYILCDSKNHPLYVGMSRNIPARISRHRSTQPWSAEVAKVVIRDTLKDGERARFLETYLIQRLRPKHNRAENQGVRRLTLADFTEWQIEHMNPSLRKCLEGPFRGVRDTVTEDRLNALVNAAESNWMVGRGEDRDARGGLFG